MSRSLTLFFVAVMLLRAAEPSPDTTAAFDRYVKVTEEQLKKRTGRDDFLWIGQHAKEKNFVWLGQTIVVPQKTLDQGKEIDVPGGLLQDWLGNIFLEGVTLEHLRDWMLNYGDYKYYFKAQVIDSREIKRDGDHFDAFLRLSKSQFTGIVLNTTLSTDYTVVDPFRSFIFSRSTHIGEALHPNRKKTFDKEQSPEDEYGYLWRLNMYWRLEQNDGGTYVELELISLSRVPGGLSRGRFLSGYQDLPQELVTGIMEGLRNAYPRLR